MITRALYMKINKITLIYITKIYMEKVFLVQTNHDSKTNHGNNFIELF